MKFISLTLLLLLLLLDSPHSLAQREKIDPISFGRVKLAHNRPAIDLDTFVIKSEGSFAIDAQMIKNSLQWIRMNGPLLVPRALVWVRFKAPPKAEYHWQYNNQKMIPLFDEQTGEYQAKIFLSLFESLPLELYHNNQVVNRVRLTPKLGEVSHLIDHSCAPYTVQIEGMKSDYVSVGCKMERTGEFGEEKPYLEVLFTSASYRLKNDSSPPYSIIFHQTGKAHVALVNDEGHEEVLTLKASLPQKLPRMKIAAGFGPYNLETKDQKTKRDYQLAPTLMLYGNFYLNESSSLRFFDSYSKNVTLFHNWGLYFAWDLAEFCDRRCLLTSLIGTQGVDYRFSSNHELVSDLIFPQGFEFILKHPFGKLNYRFAYGMFASLSAPYDYQNIWIRYGKDYFWELNYIEWQRDGRKASMYGLSIGFPLASFF